MYSWGKLMLSPFSFFYSYNNQNRLFLNMQVVKYTFNKTERLKSRKLIESLFENGKTLNNYPFKVLYNLSNNPDFEHPAKIAISVSKKHFKRAVDRNYIKRKIKEAYRKNKHRLYEMLKEYDQNIYFIVIYVTNVNLEYKIIEEKTELLIEKMTTKIKGDLEHKSV